MSQAYARALEEARKELVGSVPEVVAQSAGTVWSPADAGVENAMDADAAGPNAEGAGSGGSFRVPFMDLTLEVSFPAGVVRFDGREAQVDVTVVVVHYLARSVGPLDLADSVRYMGLDGASAFAAAFRSRVEVPLIGRFGEDPDAFAAAMTRLGGHEVGGGRWHVPFLPNLPLGVRMGFAEDGLPADCVILFPRRAGFVYPVEDLAVAGQLMAMHLLACAEDEAGSRHAVSALLAWAGDDGPGDDGGCHDGGP
jgi:Domain of unknown function (DUF3786)